MLGMSLVRRLRGVFDAQQRNLAAELSIEQPEPQSTEPELPAALAVSSEPVLEHTTASAAPLATTALLPQATQPGEDNLILYVRDALDTSLAWSRRAQALEWLAADPRAEAARVLARCAISSLLPPALQIQAVELLASRGPQACWFLRQILSGQNPTVARAAAALTLARAGDDRALDGLLTLLERGTPAERRAAVAALGELGGAQALLTLSAVIEREEGDAGLLLAAAAALGSLRAERAVWPLGLLLSDVIFGRLHGSWQARAALPLEAPPERWLADSGLPLSWRLELALALAAGDTPAARPSTLHEFLAGVTEQLRSVAAQSLSQLGGTAAQNLLRAALRSGPASPTTPTLVDALVEVLPDAPALVEVLTAPDCHPTVRWLLVRRLPTMRGGSAALCSLLDSAILDSFTRIAVVEALGQCATPALISLLWALIERPDADLSLRAQAVTTLGQIHDPAVLPLLLRLVCTEDGPELLSLRAIDALPVELGSDVRHLLRDLVTDRTAVPRRAALLRALGRARDRDSLPLILRYAQSGADTEIEAALLALVDLGDAVVAPVLVRISQNAGLDRALRVRAIGVLIRLCGAEYLPLIHSYLADSSLPLRLLAVEQLLEAHAPLELLSPLLSDSTAPLALRLRLLQALPAVEMLDLYAGILLDQHEDQRLRLAVASALGQLGTPQAIAALASCLERDDEAAALRWHCLHALTNGHAHAAAALSRCAVSADPLLALGATLALLNIGA